MSLVANQTKYAQIKRINFTIGKWNHGYKIITYEYIQHIKKKNKSLLKYLLEP